MEEIPLRRCRGTPPNVADPYSLKITLRDEQKREVGESVRKKLTPLDWIVCYGDAVLFRQVEEDKASDERLRREVGDHSVVGQRKRCRELGWTLWLPHLVRERHILRLIILQRLFSPPSLGEGEGERNQRLDDMERSIRDPLLVLILQNWLGFILLSQRKGESIHREIH